MFIVQEAEILQAPEERHVKAVAFLRSLINTLTLCLMSILSLRHFDSPRLILAADLLSRNAHRVRLAPRLDGELDEVSLARFFVVGYET